MTMWVLPVVWLAAEKTLDHVGQTATSVPLIRKKATAMWIFVLNYRLYYSIQLEVVK